MSRLTGYRAWRVRVLLEGEGGTLGSISEDFDWPGPVVSADHLPTSENGSGMHAYRHAGEAAYQLESYESVLGSVLLWGHVVEHELGWRAEHAQVVSIWSEVPRRVDGYGLPFTWQPVNPAILQLLEERYQCDIVPHPLEAEQRPARTPKRSKVQRQAASMSLSAIDAAMKAIFAAPTIPTLWDTSALLGDPSVYHKWWREDLSVLFRPTLEEVRRFSVLTPDIEIAPAYEDEIVQSAVLEITRRTTSLLDQAFLKGFRP